MDIHEHQVRQHTKRAAFVLQMVLLFLMMALSGLIGVIWFGGERLLFPPTPTATATTGAALAPTADFRATLIAEDVATQEAYSTLAAALGLSPLVAPTQRGEAVATMVVSITVIPYGESATPATAFPSTANNGGSDSLVTISLPMVANASILPTPTPTAIVFSDLPTETPLPIPTDTPIIPPTDTPTLVPSTPTFTPTPTYFVLSQRAVIVATPVATLRTGPSNLYGATDTLPGGTIVNLIGRDETGEWVLLCCVNNAPRWLRQVYAPPKENTPQPGAPLGSNADDIRWLKVEVAPPTTVPILTPTPIPDSSFPQFRRERGNSGRLPKLPVWPLTPAWTNPNRANGVITAPIVAANNKVFMSSTDNRLYALDAATGNQQWHMDVGAQIQFSPVVQDNYIYFVDTQKRISAVQFDVQNQANQYQLLWQKSLPGDALTSLYLADKWLFVIYRDGSGLDHLYAVDRTTNDPNATRTYNAASKMAPVMAIGNQLIYVSDPDLRALDINDFSVIWTRDDIENLQAPPVFMLNGPNALAELYVVDNSASGIRLHALNANTGRAIWTTGINRDVSGLAVGDSAVYVTGEGYLLAIARQAGNATLLNISLSGRAMGGPFVDGSQVLLVTNGGNLQVINLNGQITGGQLLTNGLQAIGAPVVVAPYLYIPTNDTVVAAFKGQ